MLLVVPGWGQDNPTAPTASPGYYAVQCLLSLVIVLAVIYGLHAVLQRKGLWGIRLRGQGPAEVVQSLPLGGGHVLHVVRVGRRALLVGTGPGGIRTLAELDEQELRAQRPDGEGEGA
jgi:flagellar biogenesis protein FliO